MEHYVHNEGVELYKKLIAESECEQSQDEDRHAMLLKHRNSPRTR